MEDINKIFQAALEGFTARRGNQAALAERAGVSASYINDMLKGRRGGTEEKRRALAAALGYPGRRYEDFLDLGRSAIGGWPAPGPPAGEAGALAVAGYFKIPVERNGAQGPGGAQEPGFLLLHGPSLGHKSAGGLLGFPAPDDSMEPIFAAGGLAVADLTRNRLENLREGAPYALRCGPGGAVAIKNLRWAERGRILAVESENRLYGPVFRKVKEVHLLGLVIWSCREHA